MRSKYLVLLPVMAVLAFSCHKDHNNSMNPNHPISDTSLTLATAVVTNITDTNAVSGGSFTAVGSAIVIHYKGVEWDTSANFSNYWQRETSFKVRMITPAGAVSTVAGTGAIGAQDGNSAIATFNAPIGLAVDNLGNLIVADGGNHKIRKITLH